ncbi:hypothetical protein [Microtetraspora malaysiensis]|uniref:Uncharacterized protein n=1 Tax=Microtetraspora malaysiensis TaxID=161358 RepID=A0ABW6T485_9ACTN
MAWVSPSRSLTFGAYLDQWICGIEWENTDLDDAKTSGVLESEDEDGL